uniref:Methyltransferase like 15 n=1 Tax=Sinocyclocheilus anshuiensis TaxID=1608454 RepID=A0A671QB88_9TELE
MPLYCSHFMVAPCKRTLGDVVPDNNSKMFRRCWRKLRHPVRHYTGSVTSSPDSDEKPFHTPVMVKEVLQFLDIKPGRSVVLDLTFGAGGHSKAILQSVPGITVVAADRDPTVFQMAQGRVKPVLGRFSELNNLLPALGFVPGGVDAALLDAGCSSMQMDSAERDFSLSKNGLLDMRMDGDRFDYYLGTPTCPARLTWSTALDQQALASVLAAYGEERHTSKIAAAITQASTPSVGPLFLASVLYARRDRLQRPSHITTKTFQALRIFVNDELNELHAGLHVAQTLLRPKGRLCVLTFHSLEDRLTKRFLHGEDLAAPPRRSLRQRAKARSADKYWVSLKNVIKPSEKEVQENPRARSAKFRTVVRR